MAHILRKSLLFLLLSFPFFPLLTNSRTQPPTKSIKTIPATETSLKQKKITHLHFYFHDIIGGPKPTAIPVTKPLPNPSSSSSFFGIITMMDDPLTEGPDLNSKLVGRAQGMYASAAQNELGFLQAMNLCFTQGEYNGSVLTVLGHNAVMNPIREMPVVGGSGLFRFASGFALARTYKIDWKSATVEYNITVMHY